MTDAVTDGKFPSSYRSCTTRTREQVEVVRPAAAAGLRGRRSAAVLHLDCEDEFQMFGRRYEGCGWVDDRTRAQVIGHRIHVANKLGLPVPRSRRALRSWCSYKTVYRYHEAVGFSLHLMFIIVSVIRHGSVG